MFSAALDVFIYAVADDNMRHILINLIEACSTSGIHNLPQLLQVWSTETTEENLAN